MRLQWVWLVAALAMIGGLVQPWGHKHVLDEHCETAWDQATYETNKYCSADEWSVAYRPLSMVTEHTPYASLDEPSETKAWAYGYGDPEAPHHEGLGPLLSVAGPALLLGTAVMALLGIMHQVLQTRQSLLLARIGWSVHLGLMATFVAGMAYHAGTWRAEHVDNLVPGLGLAFGAASLLAGVPLLPEREADGMPSLPSL